MVMIIIVNPIGMMIDLVDTLVRLLLYIKTVFRCLIWCSQAVTLHVWVTVILGINVKDILEKYFLGGKPGTSKDTERNHWTTLFFKQVTLFVYLFNFSYNRNYRRWCICLVIPKFALQINWLVSIFWQLWRLMS